MLVVIVNFPPVRDGQDAEFREWFAWSNNEFGKLKGFIGRRLLEPLQGGTYVAIMEYESEEAFAAMQNSPSHNEAGRRVIPLLAGSPTPRLYEVVGV